MVYAAVSEHESQRVEKWMWSCPLLSTRMSSFRPVWSGVLAKEVGGELKPEAPGIGAKGIEEGEEVLGAENSVTKCKCQGRRNNTPAILYHPRVWSPLHSCCLSRSMDYRLSWGHRQGKKDQEEPSSALAFA